MLLPVVGLSQLCLLAGSPMVFFAIVTFLPVRRLADTAPDEVLRDLDRS